MYRLLFIHIFILLIFLCPSCSEKTEGCLDIEALDYNVAADVDCCCTYPELVLNVSHKFDTLALRLGNEFTLNEIDTFIVNESKILFSRMHPRQNGIISFVDDTIHIPLDATGGNTLLEIEDNFILVQPDEFVYPIGTFVGPGIYDELEFRFGLEGDLNLIIPDSVHQTDHVLRSESDSVWSDDKGYFYMYLDITPNKEQPDITKEVIIYDEANQLDFLLSGELVAGTGYDFEVNITIDYKLLYQGIEFVTDDELTIAQKIQQNLMNSIYLTE